VRPRGIHHVSVNVADVQAAARFYVDVLGFELRDDRPADLGVEGAWLDAGEQQLHLIAGATPAAAGQHFAVLVDDLDAAVAEARSFGIEVTDPSPVGSGRQAFLADPSGNTVELHAREA
jgi:glyoxylase I family protein